ncbi:ABC transporter family substrate-binding protein [Rhodococcus hoagii]|uniref:ABC transporter, substrate-binding protein, family 5 n=3 Tax=Rhodococcus hoagii TaxID=43767 RepID=F1TJL5_RHOHA|nr:ABC transporter, substrate-binding protein, family 5 [Prescottella equi ATCC 33707]MBM4478770.1 ABC transporter family substrate-binding protein [Prescottella equi]GBF13894.1 putative monoacyl phosphatidylinositol tetramannoside-binding protein LpqW precursor [Rhodococcus sp. Br-6]MBM4492334.1 ABC transporter family substrate-binding protein [Prescottella equi]MBM4521632.1 ABC transporter family substrate-binding protein [Prescottella equi]
MAHVRHGMFRALVPRTLAAVSLLALAACTANPPPPVESTDSPKPTTAVPTKNTVAVAIDDVGIGFNPHLLADQSPVNSAVSALVLPSPFRPALDPARPGVTLWVPDPSVLVSATAVPPEAPTTITYQLRNEAQWSDGAPIAAEDFRYLWQQMITQPGVVDPAGYGLIDDVESSGGGKTVTVTLTAPYPAWRELFTDLLPSHLVKDTPGGFARGLGDSIPVSGAQFHIKSVDRGRDEIVLERNDRFWGTPAKADQILMRRGGSPAQLADSIRSGDAQVARVHGGAATLGQLSVIPSVRTGTELQPRVLSVTLNGRVSTLAEPTVRKGLFGLLDPNLLATVGAGSESSATPARAQVLAPSDPGYAPTAPPPPTREQAFGALAGAGFQVVPTLAEGNDPETVTVGRLVRDNEQLTLVLGAPENDDIAIAVANTVADQWRGAGIAASVRALKAEDLYGEALTSGTVDAVVGWERAGSDPATSLASRFGCLPLDTSESAPDTTPQTTSPAPTSAATPAPSVRSPSNLSGLCDPGLQPGIDAALRGLDDPARVIADAEPRLWELAAVLPVLQDNAIVVAGPGVEGVSLAGPIPVGIFGDAGVWTRTTK